MPLFGAHFSVAGGLLTAVETAVRFQADTLQLFTKNASQWSGKPLRTEDVTAFKEAVTAAGLTHTTAHDSYLINLASPNDELYEKSIAAFLDELDRAETLGLTYLVTHPGAHVGSGEEAGLNRVVAALNRVFEERPDYAVTVLLETTAGQGSSLGCRFEHLASLLERVEASHRLGVCFDTCHVFAAGYPLVTAAESADTFDEFDRVIGLDQLRLFHMNDSVKGLGSRVDRHAGLGAGEIGSELFRRIVSDPRFAHLPMILETPKEDADGREMDPVHLAMLRTFMRGAAAA